MNDRCRPAGCWKRRNWDVAPSPIAYACGRPIRRQAQAAFGGRFARLDPGQPPRKHGSGSDSGSDGFTVPVAASDAHATWLGRSSDRTASVVATGHKRGQAAGVGDATQRAAMRFAALAQRGIALAAFGVVLRGNAGPNDTPRCATGRDDVAHDDDV